MRSLHGKMNIFLLFEKEAGAKKDVTALFFNEVDRVKSDVVRIR